MATIKGLKLKQNFSTILEIDEAVIPVENLSQFIRDITNLTQNEPKTDIVNVVNETCFMERPKSNLTRTDYNKAYYAKHKDDPEWKAKQKASQKASREKRIQKKKSNQSLEQIKN
jgi:hypothetical protein